MDQTTPQLQNLYWHNPYNDSYRSYLSGEDALMNLQSSADLQILAANPYVGGGSYWTDGELMNLAGNPLVGGSHWSSGLTNLETSFVENTEA